MWVLMAGRRSDPMAEDEEIPVRSLKRFFSGFKWFLGGIGVLFVIFVTPALDDFGTRFMHWLSPPDVDVTCRFVAEELPPPSSKVQLTFAVRTFRIQDHPNISFAAISKTGYSAFKFVARNSGEAHLHSLAVHHTQFVWSNEFRKMVLVLSDFRFQNSEEPLPEDYAYKPPRRDWLYIRDLESRQLVSSAAIGGSVSRLNSELRLTDVYNFQIEATPHEGESPIQTVCRFFVQGDAIYRSDDEYAKANSDLAELRAEIDRSEAKTGH